MANLARTTSRAPARTGGPTGKTKVLLVRQPVKSVRKSDEPDRTILRLVIGVIVALGIVGTVWLMGYLGFRLGFAPLMRVPDLMTEDGGGLATGTMMLISVPQVILQSGMAQPMWLMLGMVLIAIPSASLGAIKPTSPGGPRPKPAIVVISFTGAIVAAFNGLAMIAWTVSPFRNTLLADMPADPYLAEQWLANLQTVGGLDVLGTIAAAVWVVVVMRLAIPRWLRGLSASACYFALVVIMVATAMSNASIAQITAGRSVFHSENSGADEEMLLGFTPQYMVSLRVVGKTCFVDLRNRPSELTLLGKRGKLSIVDFLITERPPQSE